MLASVFVRELGYSWKSLPVISIPFLFYSTRHFTLILCLAMFVVTFFGVFLFYSRRDEKNDNDSRELVFFLFFMLTVFPLEVVEYGIKLSAYGIEPFPFELIVTPVCAIILGVVSLRISSLSIKKNRNSDTGVNIREWLIKQYNFTSRESDVGVLLADGKTNKEIAALLFISRRTVERHIENIYGKANAHSKVLFVSRILKEFKKTV